MKRRKKLTPFGIKHQKALQSIQVDLDAFFRTDPQTPAEIEREDDIAELQAIAHRFADSQQLGGFIEQALECCKNIIQNERKKKYAAQRPKKARRRKHR